MLCVSDCVGDSVSVAIPQPTEWQTAGNQIDGRVYLCAVGLRKGPQAMV